MAGKSKYVVVVSIICSVLVAAMTGVAATLPYWYTIRDAYAASYNVGPFHVCYSYYGASICTPVAGDCNFYSLYSGSYPITSSCPLSRTSTAFLLLGGIFSIINVISMIISVFVKLRGRMAHAMNIIPLVLHTVTVMFYIVVVSVVATNAARIGNGYPYATANLSISFYLSAACAGVTAISCIIYSIFGICLNRRSDAEEARGMGIDLAPLINSAGMSDSQPPMLTPVMAGAPVHPPYQQQFSPQPYPVQYPHYYPPNIYPPVEPQPVQPQPSPYTSTRQYQAHSYQ
jgi:hypothetical protein